ncbi:MAG: hypothetical protein IJ688_01860 [Treponema sp.]|nr:hypothetical protein [Treponema sp.]
MLSSILSKSDCAACRFCCSFRRQSLWETPIFDASTVEKLRVLYPKTKFRPVGKASYTFDISDQYKTNAPKEEAPCPFLDINSGCILPPDLKPFDCSIWPFRAVRRTETGKQPLYVALTPTCPAINKVPQAKINSLVQEEGLGKKILDYAKEHPDIIKDWSEFLSNNVYEEN